MSIPHDLRRTAVRNFERAGATLGTLFSIIYDDLRKVLVTAPKPYGNAMVTD